MALQRCPGIPPSRCGKLTTKRYCDEHLAVRENIALRAKRAARPYTAEERERRAQAVRDWVRDNGQVCPGWRTPRHEITEWTGPLAGEHPDPVGAGGAEGQPLGVLCRWCNSRKGKQQDR